MIRHDPAQIDLVAARLTSAQAPDVRDAVLARLAPRPRVRWTWVVVPLTAATAALAIGISLNRSAEPTPLVSVPTPARAASVAGAIETTPSAADSAIVAPAPRVRRALSNHTATSEWRARAVPALDRIASISVEAIQPDALSIAQLEVKPIVMPPIDGGGDR